MDIWSIRDQALLDIADNLKNENEALQQAFVVLEMCAKRFLDAIHNSDQHEFVAVMCQTLIKARNYAFGCYSVCLEGFHQQAGALLRPLTEALELIIFFRQDPTRVQFVVPVYQPKKLEAGYVARIIGGTLKPLRDYLNSFASHLSLQPESWVGLENTYNRETLKAAIRTLYAITWTIARQATECLLDIGELDDDMKDAIDESRRNGIQVFRLEEYLQGEAAEPLG